MSHSLEELVGQFDLVQRSLLLTYVWLEQAPISFIYGPYPLRASSDQTDVFIAKDAVLLIVRLRAWLIACLPATLCPALIDLLGFFR
jgi:hypothetical protein